MLDCLAGYGGGRAAVRLVVLASVLWAGAPWRGWSQPRPASADWVVDSWPAEPGLPLNAITAILQGWDGYLWIATSNGLARFDGVRFMTFRSTDSPGLRNNCILCLHEDAYGVLWIGTDGGGLVSYHSGQFTAMGREEGLSSDTVLCLGEDVAGRLWAGTDSGLTLCDAGQLVTFFKTDGLPDDRVTSICQPVGQPLLIGTAQRVCQYHRDAFAVCELPIAPEAQTNVTCLLEDQRRQLWVGGQSGLFCLPGTNGVRHAPRVDSRAVTALLERQDREIWFGTKQGELCRVITNESGLHVESIWRSPRSVTALCEDRENNLWVGTAGEGLHRVKRRRLRLVPWPESKAASGSPCLLLTPQGDLRLVGGDRNLYGWQDGAFKTLTRLPLPEGVGIQTVCQTRDDEIWVGTSSDGLLRCGDGQLAQFSERAGISDSAIEALCGDGAGGLWIGTRNGGLNQFRDRTVTRFNTPWGFHGRCASVLERDLQGALWIGTTGDGLFCLREGRFTGYTTASGLPSDQVLALHADDAGSLWVGTSKGLCRLRDGRVATFTTGNSLVEEAVLQLDSDTETNLWVGAANRIYRVNKDELDAVARGQAPFVNVITYDKQDGLPGIQCVPHVQWGRRHRRDGDVCFACTRGLVVVERGGRPWNRIPPPVVLEEVFVNNASVPFERGVRVAPGNGSLRFAFTALSLTAPSKVRFRYRLEGFDTDWSEPAPAREARYPKVPPGEYRFQVVASNNDGVWNEMGAQAMITVAAFWWQTPWFQGSIALAAVATIGGLYQLRRNRRREIERLRVRIAGDLHDDIGSSLWSITLLSRMLAKHGSLGNEERQDVEEIQRIAVQTSNSIRDIIWLINPAFDTLQDFMLRTQDFAGTALRGIEYRVDCKGAILSRKLPFDLRHNLFLFFKEALTNIGRHAQATVVEVRVEDKGHTWCLTVQDNGRGFDPASRTGGNGLRNLRARAGRMKATFDIQSRPGQGTRLTLSLPAD